MRRMILAAAALLSLSGAGTAMAENYAEGSLTHYLRVEWQASRDARGAVVDGYVYNMYGQHADRMRLRVDRLDGAGRVVGSSSTWVLGMVPPNNRAYFTTRVPEAAAYRVTIVSFDWVGRGGA